MLVVSHLRKSYGRQLAVDDVSLTVGRGEVVGFVGPNGAGKSTTLRMLTGLLHPDAGAVVLDDVHLARDRRAFLARVGALIEAPGLYPMLTAVAHLRYLGRLRGRVDEALVRETLTEVGLDPASRKIARHFSLGMKQRLGLAMALYGRPSLLVLDEPMNGLDPTGIADLRRFIRTIPGRFGSSVLVSSHLLAEVEHTCDRVVFLRAGRIAGETVLKASGQGGGAISVWLRTGDDARAMALLGQAGFVHSVEAGGQEGVVCQIAADDLGQIAPLLVQHQIALLEMTTRGHRVEQAYFAHVVRPEGQVML